jgi:polar amino acid transport system permease protein
MVKRIKSRWVDAALILLCVVAGIFFFFRIKYGLKSNINFADMGRFFFARNAETGRWEARFLVLGLIATIKISIWAMIPATIVGMILGIFRTSGNLFMRMVGRAYVETIRNLPPLVLIFIFYFFVADQIMSLIGVEGFVRGLSERSQAILAFLFADKTLFVPFLSGVLTLAFFVGAYITEIVRAGIESVETGQRQAAYSLGLSWLDEMRFIILPQAIKVVVPALANEYINVVKYSSIMSVVSIQELTYMGVQVNLLKSDLLTVWLTISFMYIVLTSSLSLIANRLEVRMARSN